MVLPPAMQAEAGEGVEDDLGEAVEVADDEGEDADIEGLLDQAREHVLVGRQGPEQAGEGDVDRRSARRRASATSPWSRPKPRVDVLGEDAQEAIDDAGAAHGTLSARCGMPCSAGTSARSAAGSPARSRGSAAAARGPAPGSATARAPSRLWARAMRGHDGGQVGELLGLQRDELVAGLRGLQRARRGLARRDQRVDLARACCRDC